MRFYLAIAILALTAAVLFRRRTESFFYEGPSEASRGGIPRILVQTHRYEAYDRVPMSLRVKMQALRDQNPSWSYRYYNDAQQRAFIQKHMTDRVLRAYDKLNPVYTPARADFFRYVVIYVHGGVYLDCKSGSERPLDDVMRDQASLVLMHWMHSNPHRLLQLQNLDNLNARGEYANWIIAAPPKDPTLKHVIHRVVEHIESESRRPTRERMTGKKGVLHITGPIIFTIAAIEYRRRHGMALNSQSNHKLGMMYRAPQGDEKHPDELSSTHYSKIRGIPVVLKN